MFIFWSSFFMKLLFIPIYAFQRSDVSEANLEPQPLIGIDKPKNIKIRNTCTDCVCFDRWLETLQFITQSSIIKSVVKSASKTENN